MEITLNDLPNMMMNASERLGDDSPYVNVVDRYLHRQAQMRNDGQHRDWRGIRHTLLLLPEPLLVVHGDTHWMRVEAAIIAEHPDGVVGVWYCTNQDGARQHWDMSYD